ncbi:MAG: Cof-type HAD-IIB family hydrolase [Prevotella sp.]|nr:Cof-type HAD-IIB family hydrolase [Prevotella sp.]
MLKAVFFDIDGTLVSFKTHRVPQSTLDAVSRIRRQGVKVFIATGRPLPFINNLAELEYDGIMSVNGACCFTKEGQIITRKPVPKADIQRLVDDAKAHPMPIAFATHDKAIAVNPGKDMEHLKEVFALLDLTVPEQRPIEDALDMEVLQVIAFFTKEQEGRIMQEVLKGCDANRWHPYFADCVAKGINKATGIDDICKYYGINLKDTAAFGDGGNDIAMLSHAGIGIAMGNAAEEVQASADMVTDSVDENGIANALKHLFPQCFTTEQRSKTLY